MNALPKQHETVADPVPHYLGLNRALVIISPDLISPDAPQQSVLLNRAVELARATGCDLELFHVCYDGAVSPTMFLDRQQQRDVEQAAMTRDRQLLEDMVAHLDSPELSVQIDVCWDASRTDAILSKIDAYQPDLVLKQSRDHKYLVGLASHSDWELIRKSPADLWFVTEEGAGSVDRLVSAVGAESESDEVISPADFSAFRLAKTLADGFGAMNYPVHAYQAPLGVAQLVGYAPQFDSSANPLAGREAVRESRDAIARKHGRAIEAFAEHFEIDPIQVRLVEGDADVVLPQMAQTLSADVLVMSARNLSRWERFSQKLIAEPVLAEAPCDLVVVKQTERTPEPQEPPALRLA